MTDLQATPFIIWTLQRTGGTNLAHRLCERSSLSGTQHEPFNRGRAYGFVTTSWSNNHDHIALEAAIEEIIDAKPLIKHCVENVPMALNEELARASCAAGYKHLFLYRQQPLDRLLSLHFAQSTDIWGPEISDKTEFNDEVFDNHLPVDNLVARELRCSNRLRSMWDLLNQLGGRPVAVSFEQLYASVDAEATRQTIRGLLGYLGLSQGEGPDEQFIDEVLHRGAQGTRSKYHKFSGVEELQRRLEQIEIFDLTTVSLDVVISDLHAEQSAVRYAIIDTKPAKVMEGETYDVEGVVVLDKVDTADYRLTLQIGSDVEAVRWGIPSAKMAQRYPDATNSQNARFHIKNLVATPGCEYRICLTHKSGKATELFRIRNGLSRET